jgi:hypothetical protein
MRRVSTAIASAAILASLFPAVVAAAPVLKFEDHRITVFCETELPDDGFVSGLLEVSDAFGPFAGAEIWMDGAVAFEDPPTLTGTSAIVGLDEGDPITMSADLAFADAEGSPEGSGHLAATVVRTGEVVVDEPTAPGNPNTHTRFEIQALEGSGAIELPDGSTIELECFGEIVDESIHETQPTAFTLNNAGVRLDCLWETEDGFAFLFAIDDIFGPFAEAGLESEAASLFQIEDAEGSISPSGASLDFLLLDAETETPVTGAADAEFTPSGEPVTSRFTSQHGKVRTTQQALSVDGTLAFSTGHTFPIDDAHCRADAFESHSIGTSPSGPKPGRAPANDTPDRAFPLEIGSVVNQQTTGTANEAEAGITTCPQGEDDAMGHTLWYAIEGTGDPITVDSTGSNFDTVLAAYVREGGELVEIACQDDVEPDPVGGSLQGQLTFDSEAGVTYLVQAGGFLGFFEEEAEAGRLRIRVR